jgi:hypothetical protein
MPLVAIFGYTREMVIAAVQEIYTAVAAIPARTFHLPFLLRHNREVSLA